MLCDDYLFLLVFYYVREVHHTVTPGPQGAVDTEYREGIKDLLMYASVEVKIGDTVSFCKGQHRILFETCSMHSTNDFLIRLYRSSLLLLKRPANNYIMCSKLKARAERAKREKRARVCKSVKSVRIHDYCFFLFSYCFEVFSFLANRFCFSLSQRTVHAKGCVDLSSWKNTILISTSTLPCFQIPMISHSFHIPNSGFWSF